MSKFRHNLEALRPDPQIKYEDRRGQTSAAKDQSSVPTIDVSDNSSTTDYSLNPQLPNTYVQGKAEGGLITGQPQMPTQQPVPPITQGYSPWQLGTGGAMNPASSGVPSALTQALTNYQT